MRLCERFLPCLLPLLLSSCTCDGPGSFGPKTLAPFRATSRPYQIKGVWYYPQAHYELEEIGVASWYGERDGCHGRPQATGVLFDMYQHTAAHKTLPLPCMARVTNLENGRSIILKISDRGPFKYDRVLDVSAAAARALGFYQQGTARVHVKTLVAESASLPENQSPSRRGNQTLKKGLKNGIQQRGTSVKRPPLLPLSVTLDALCETPDASPSPSLDALLAG